MKNINYIFKPYFKLLEIIRKRKYSNFYSQYHQDVICLERYFEDLDTGVFVEVGADDGISKSNTYLYELLGWNGICIEPSPERFKLLNKNRSCICENYAIAEYEKNVDFMDILGYGKGLSGIIDEYNERHKERIKKELNHPLNKGYEVVQVKTISLSKLLEKHNLYHINFCSIDVEGAELSVLESINFESYKFDVILVENNYNDDSIRMFMEEKGFKKKESIGPDEIYVTNYK